MARADGAFALPDKDRAGDFSISFIGLYLQAQSDHFGVTQWAATIPKVDRLEGTEAEVLQLLIALSKRKSAGSNEIRIAVF